MLTIVVRSLVDQPDVVTVTRTTEENQTTFHVKVDPSDMGKVVGINGRTARALRTILAANAARLRRTLSLDMGERTHNEAGSSEAESC